MIYKNAIVSIMKMIIRGAQWFLSEQFGGPCACNLLDLAKLLLDELRRDALGALNGQAQGTRPHALWGGACNIQSGEVCSVRF